MKATAGKQHEKWLSIAGDNYAQVNAQTRVAIRELPSWLSG